MNIQGQTNSHDRDLERLERLSEENQALRAQQSHLVKNHHKWRNKAENVQTKVESMIMRLKAMEQGK